MRCCVKIVNVQTKITGTLYVSNVMEAIELAGVNTVNRQHTGGQNDVNRPGWTESASDLYDMSRDVYFLWKDSGSPR